MLNTGRMNESRPLCGITSDLPFGDINITGSGLVRLNILYCVTYLILVSTELRQCISSDFVFWYLLLQQ